MKQDYYRVVNEEEWHLIVRNAEISGCREEWGVHKKGSGVFVFNRSVTMEQILDYVNSKGSLDSTTYHLIAFGSIWPKRFITDSSATGKPWEKASRFHRGSIKETYVRSHGFMHVCEFIMK